MKRKIFWALALLAVLAATIFATSSLKEYRDKALAQGVKFYQLRAEAEDKFLRLAEDLIPVLQDLIRKAEEAGIKNPDLLDPYREGAVRQRIILSLRPLCMPLSFAVNCNDESIQTVAGAMLSAGEMIIETTVRFGNTPEQAALSSTGAADQEEAIRIILKKLDPYYARYRAAVCHAPLSKEDVDKYPTKSCAAKIIKL